MHTIYFFNNLTFVCFSIQILNGLMTNYVENTKNNSKFGRMPIKQNDVVPI